jgi:hypothetical protein
MLTSRRDKTKFAPLHVTVGDGSAARRIGRRLERGSDRRTGKTVSPEQRRIGVEHLLSGLLERSEEGLLAAALAHHPHCAAALDALLDDVEQVDDATAAESRRVLPTGDVAREQRMEDLLLEAIVRTHPNRDAALDRLLADACGDAALEGSYDESAERAQFDQQIDNDFDGLA